MTEEIRIPDLRNPVLTEMQKGALKFGETLDIDLSQDAILRGAREATGLSDFGSDDFRERLNLLLDEWGSDEGLTGLAWRPRVKGRLGIVFDRQLDRFGLIVVGEFRD